jgi:hypothetical protein
MYKIKNMENSNKNKLVAIGLLGLGAILMVPLGLQLINNNPDSTSALNNYPQQQLEGTEVLETQDFNGNSPKFRLNLQTNKQFSSKPQKIVLIDKASNKGKVELPLTASQYPNECVAHDAMQDSVQKWDTEWFTVNNLSQVDNSYASKLSDNYTVQVVYEDGSSAKVYSSLDSIAGVCYQVSKLTPSTPNPAEELPED